MTTLPKFSRSDFVRQRRSSKTRTTQPQKQSGQTGHKIYHHTSMSLPVELRPATRRTQPKIQGIAPSRTTNMRKNGYDIAFSLGQTDVRAPTLTLPQFGPRWISAGLTLLLSFFLFTMWTASPFMVMTADVRGNQRLGATDINANLGMIGRPIFKAVPEQIEANLRTAYADLEYVKVHVGFPNHITVDVKERTPILVWNQNGSAMLIDANGVAFPLRGDVSGLAQVTANSAPAQIPLDPSLSIYEQKFISPEMVQALITLAPDVPTGMQMIFDPQYGMGWQDPRGWTVYFGQNTKDIPMKMVVYQAIVDTLTLQGVQPSLISVEYLNAPFYK